MKKLRFYAGWVVFVLLLLPLLPVIGLCKLANYADAKVEGYANAVTRLIMKIEGDQ